MNVPIKQLQEGDVIVSYDGNFISTIINNLTNTHKHKAGHVAFIIDGKILESTGEGVHFSELNIDWFSKYKEITILKPSDKIDINKFIKDVKKYIGKPYGFWQIFVDLWVFIWNKITKKDNRKNLGESDPSRGIVCSELGSKALKKQGLHVRPGISPAYTSPSDYLFSDLFIITIHIKK
jgi:hypothetical protein